MDTPIATFRNKMLAEWLQGVDQMLHTDSPTWKRLVKALKDPRVGQKEVASKIELDKQLVETSKSINVENSPIANRCCVMFS